MEKALVTAEISNDQPADVNIFKNSGGLSQTTVSQYTHSWFNNRWKNEIRTPPPSPFNSSQCNRF